MAWGDDVHNSRLTQSLSDARKAIALRRRKQPVVVGPNAQPLQSLTVMGAAATYVLWQLHSAKLQNVQWKNLPVLKQFNDLIFGAGGTKLAAAKSKNKKQRSKTAAAKAATAAKSGSVTQPAVKEVTTAATSETSTNPTAPSTPVPAPPKHSGSMQRQSSLTSTKAPAPKPALLTVSSSNWRPKPADQPDKVARWELEEPNKSVKV